jgi:hypothetical protein
MLTTAQAIQKYGQPNEKGTYLKTINSTLPDAHSLGHKHESNKDALPQGCRRCVFKRV